MRTSLLRVAVPLVRLQATKTRIRCRQLSAVAHQLQPQPKTASEPISISHEQLRTRSRPNPHILVAAELAHIRKCMLNLLGAAHPGLAEVAQHFFAQPSSQLRSIVILLFARATNGLGRNWEQKGWEAECETIAGRADEFDKPLYLSDILHEWNANMPDHSESFESVFELQEAISRPPCPPPLPTTRPFQNLTSRQTTAPSLLPTQVRLAQIMEMIHIASLFHNDIGPTLDCAQPSESPNEEGPVYGNNLAILGGDFLLGRASWALSRLGESEVVELVSSVISNQVEGEFLQMGEVRTPAAGAFSAPKNLPEAWELYLNQTYMKTGSLMGKAARASVILGGCEQGDILREVAYLYGRNLGIAYQLAQDAQNMKELQPGQFVTGPALFASEECPSLVPLIERRFTGRGDLKTAIQCIQTTSAVERTQALAHLYAEKARGFLGLIPDCESKFALDTLLDIVIKRT
ncbi:isoprenoid synthase domain-containing protein [Crepidotus variabilis]|uniref:Isoprenoid synthase domain-containing protein n=1 Tax=Crepidotus variabilis TaxID=179855 RepID=A0A9P6EMI5_9AGAR|nr:isoprenoid synthase domain-containing protein [Crepidotus variabilis]